MRRVSVAGLVLLTVSCATAPPTSQDGDRRATMNSLLLRVVAGVDQAPAARIEIDALAPLPDSARDHLKRTGQLPAEFASSGRQVHVLVSSSDGSIEVDGVVAGEPMLINTWDKVTIVRVVLDGAIRQVNDHTYLLWPSELDLRNGGTVHIRIGAPQRR